MARTAQFLWRRLLGGALAMCGAGVAWAASSGDEGHSPESWLPLLTPFSHAEHGGDPTHYDLALLAEGEIAVANQAGVLLFDGRRWTRLPLPRSAMARSLASDAQGRLHVGGEGEAGTWTRNAHGAWIYTDHTAALRAAGGDGPVWDTLRHGNATVFHATGVLLRIPDGGAPQTLLAPEGLRRMFSADGEVFARVADTGLVRLDAGALVAVPGSEIFGEQGLVAVLPMDSGRLLVGLEGVYRWNDAGLQRLPLAPKDAALLASANAATLLADGSLLIGNDYGELLLFDAGHRLAGRLPLSRSSILKLLPDNDGGVFVAAEDGLWRLRLPSPWRRFPAEAGLIGRPVDIASTAGVVRVATTLGVFRAGADASGAQFVADIETRFGAHQLLSMDDGVLVADGEGVLWHSDTKGDEQRLYSDARTWWLMPSRFAPHRAYALTDADLRVLQRDAHGWRLIASHDLGELSPESLGELDARRLVLDDAAARLHVWDLDDAGQRTAERALDVPGLADDAPRGGLHRLDDAVYLSRAGAVWRVTAEGVEPVDIAPFNRLAGKAPLQIVQNGDVALAIDAEQVLRRATRDAPWQTLALPPQEARGLSRVALGERGDVHALVWDGVLHYRAIEAPPPLPAIGWQRVSARHIDLAGRESPLPRDTTITVPGDAAGLLRVDLRPRTLDREVAWRYRLQAADAAATDDTPWTTQPADAGDIVLPLPAPGRYTLQVDGHSASGRAVLPHALAIEIVPAWWQTLHGRIALILAALSLLALGGYGILRWRLKRVEARSRRLEKLVRKRTRDLEMTAASLAQANADLQASHVALQDSSRRSDLIFKALNDALEGEELDGRYRIEGRLGSGGFGTVYRARHLQLGTPAAIKIFKPSSGEDREASMARFRGEGISAFRVQHPNAVQVIDFAICLDAVPYLVMELLEGETLEAELARRGPLTPRRALDVLTPVCQALAAAHAAGVIHRDVKPGNIFLQRSDAGRQIKLIDFGIAKLVESDSQLWESARTGTGLFVGTPNYMAPERLSAKPYDDRSDIYALGVVAFEALSGHRPFETTQRDAVSLIMAILSETPANLASLAPTTPPELAALVMRLLDRDPALRPTAQELVSILAALREALPTDDEAAATAASPPAPVALATAITPAPAQTLQAPRSDATGGAS